MLRTALAIILISGNALATTEPIDKLAEELIKLRSSIETVHDEIEQNKDDFRSRIQSLNLMKSDLMATNQREELKIKQLHQQKNSAIDALKVKFSGNTDIQSLVEDTGSELKQYIISSLPFRSQERLQMVEKFEVEVKNNQVSPYKAANRIWGFIEDELRLQKDIGIYKQVIKVDGDEQLCELAKIGMMTFYFKSPNEKYGLVRKKDNQWVVSIVEDDTQKQKLDDIFVMLKKQIRVGTFNLPKFL